MAARLAFAVVLAALAATPARAEPNESIDRGRLERHVRALADEIGPRVRNTEGAARAQRAIVRAAAELGLTPERLPVGTVVSPRIEVAGRLIMQREEHRVLDDNLVLRIAGTEDGPAILLMAHYDTLAGTPGAVDNATGVAILLELARVLTAQPPARSVTLAWTASEERGLAGARALARDLTEPIGLAISLDLIGAADEVSLNGLSSLLGEDWLAWLAAAARDAGVDVAAPLPHRVISRHLPAIERSDHGAFTERDLPALHLYSRGDDRIYLDYHAPTDTPDRIHWSAVTGAADYLVAIARKPGPLPEAGGAPGIWLPVPGGPRVLSSWALLLLEALLLAAAAAGLVPLWRRRQRSRQRFAVGLLGFAGVYALAWTAAFGGLALARVVTDHPAPWVHAPVPYYLGAGSIAAGVGLACAWLAGRLLPISGCGRFLAAAIALTVAAGLALVIAGAAELALPILVTAACFGIIAWTRHPIAAAVALIVSALPLGPLLGPGFLRELVFHGFAPIDAPIAIGLAGLLLPHALVCVHLARRFGPPMPARGRGAALLIAAGVAAAAVGAATVTLPSPACDADSLVRASLYCERLAD